MKVTGQNAAARNLVIAAYSPEANSLPTLNQFIVLAAAGAFNEEHSMEMERLVRLVLR